MAVAADLHRDFLIPEQIALPDKKTDLRFHALRLFFCRQ
jgi:hypothetical protein